ncbi:MAG: tetratricopeptide repeat protein [Deltaproteobacteria bacterium]|nr:tetratricopeptide repeat protein [Deltaproteobacteria bacterium]
MKTRDDNTGEPDLKLYQHYMNLAGACFSNKDIENAETFLLRSLEIYPGNTLARLYLARLYLQNKHHEDAVSQLKEILKINPYNESALAQLIQLYKDNGKNEEAKQMQANLNRAKYLRAF